MDHSLSFFKHAAMLKQQLLPRKSIVSESLAPDNRGTLFSSILLYAWLMAFLSQPSHLTIFRRDACFGASCKCHTYSGYDSPCSSSRADTDGFGTALFLIVFDRPCDMLTLCYFIIKGSYSFQKGRFFRYKNLVVKNY